MTFLVLSYPASKKKVKLLWPVYIPPFRQFLIMSVHVFLFYIKFWIEDFFTTWENVQNI